MVLKGNPNAELECVYLDTTVTFFALEASRCGEGCGAFCGSANRSAAGCMHAACCACWRRMSCWPAALSVHEPALRRSARAQVEEVARGLFFNSTLLAAADRASARLASGGGFNGVHLRLEADSGWVAKLGGMEVSQALNFGRAGIRGAASRLMLPCGCAAPA